MKLHFISKMTPDKEFGTKPEIQNHSRKFPEGCQYVHTIDKSLGYAHTTVYHPTKIPAPSVLPAGVVQLPDLPEQTLVKDIQPAIKLKMQSDLAGLGVNTAFVLAGTTVRDIVERIGQTIKGDFDPAKLPGG